MKRICSCALQGNFQDNAADSTAVVRQLSGAPHLRALSLHHIGVLDGSELQVRVCFGCF